MESIDERDIESNPYFECNICCEKSEELPIKYKCSICNEKICDDCYLKHINNKKKTCVFCRGILEISQEDITVHISSNYNKLATEMYRRNKCKICTLVFIILIWYIIFLSYLFISAEKNK